MARKVINNKRHNLHKWDISGIRLIAHKVHCLHRTTGAAEFKAEMTTIGFNLLKHTRLEAAHLQRVHFVPDIPTDSPPERCRSGSCQ